VLFARNLDYLARHELWPMYADACARMRSLSGTAILLHLVDLERVFEDLRDLTHTLPLLAEKTALQSSRRPAPLVVLRTAGVVAQSPAGRLRQALDLLTNWRYTTHIANGTLPPSLARLFDLQPERLDAARHYLRECGLVDETRFASEEVDETMVLDASERLADALLIGAPLEEPLGSALETIGSVLSDLVSSASRTLRYDGFAVERSIVPLETVYSGIDACIFNNRRYTRDAISLALDGDVEKIFLRAFRGQEVVRDLACVIAWHCRDAKETVRYLVIDGVAAADLTLRELPIDWRDVMLDALAEVARRNRAQLALAGPIDRGAPSELALLARFRERWDVGTVRLLLLKRRPSSLLCYNNIWHPPRTRSKMVGRTYLFVPRTSQSRAP
jgi:hypothetical protein